MIERVGAVLARGYDIDLRARSATRLPVASSSSLADNRNQRTLGVSCRHADGMDLVVIDSDRAAGRRRREQRQASGVGDEIAAAASEKTGALVRHPRPCRQARTTDPADAHGSTPNGHRSKLDINQAMFVFSCKKGEPTLVVRALPGRRPGGMARRLPVHHDVHGGLAQSVTATPVPVVPSAAKLSSDADRLLESLPQHGGQVNQGELAKRLSRR